MKLGFSSYTASWAVGVRGYPLPPQPLTAFDVLERTAALGLRLVQLADNLLTQLHELSADERAALRERADQHGIALEIGTRGIAADHLAAYLELAAYFGSPILRVVVDTVTDHPSPDEVIARLRPHAAAFRMAGVTLAIENHDRFRAETLAGIVRELGDWAGVCLDTVNSFGALEGPDVILPVLGPLVVNLHLKEFVIRRVDHQMGFVVTGMPAGQGMLDIPRLLRVLEPRRRVRDFNAILELWMPPVLDSAGGLIHAATVAQEDAWIAESVAYLRMLIPE